MFPFIPHGRTNVPMEYMDKCQAVHTLIPIPAAISRNKIKDVLEKRQGLPQKECLVQLNEIAIIQMRSLLGNPTIKKLSDGSQNS